jgi:hypothetical protein
MEQARIGDRHTWVMAVQIGSSIGDENGIIYTTSDPGVKKLAV